MSLLVKLTMFHNVDPGANTCVGEPSAMLGSILEARCAGQSLLMVFSIVTFAHRMGLVYRLALHKKGGGEGGGVSGALLSRSAYYNLDCRYIHSLCCWRMLGSCPGGCSADIAVSSFSVASLPSPPMFSSASLPCSVENDLDCSVPNTQEQA